MVDLQGSLTPEFAQHWVIPEKIHTPSTDGFLEVFLGGEPKAKEIQAGGGVNLHVKKSSSGIDHFQPNVSSNFQM